jgi:hypothetical protein
VPRLRVASNFGYGKAVQNREKRRIKMIIDELEKLIVAARVYLEAQTEGPVTAAEAPVASPKIRKPRTPKEPQAEKVQEQAAPAAAPAPKAELTEEQSTKEMYRITTLFVQRFQNVVPDGKTKALALLGSMFGEGVILPKLNHEQRVEWIAAMTKELGA